MELKKRPPTKYSYLTNKKIANIKRAMNMLAYGSLVLDVLIAIVTTMSLLNITTGEFVLVPIHYMLTSVVVMSLISGGMLLYLRHYEKIMAEFLRMKYKVKLPLPSYRMRYHMRWAVKRKLKEISKKLW